MVVGAGDGTGGTCDGAVVGAGVVADGGCPTDCGVVDVVAEPWEGIDGANGLGLDAK